MPADCGSARLWTTKYGKTTFETRLALGLSLALLTRFVSSSLSISQAVVLADCRLPINRQETMREQEQKTK